MAKTRIFESQKLRPGQRAAVTRGAALAVVKRRVVRGAFKLRADLLACWFAMCCCLRCLTRPTTPYVQRRPQVGGGVDQQWVALRRSGPCHARSVWRGQKTRNSQSLGLDLAAIKRAIAEGYEPWRSTLSQEGSRNVYCCTGALGAAQSA